MTAQAHPKPVQEIRALALSILGLLQQIDADEADLSALDYVVSDADKISKLADAAAQGAGR